MHLSTARTLGDRLIQGCCNCKRLGEELDDSFFDETLVQCLKIFWTALPLKVQNDIHRPNRAGKHSSVPVTITIIKLSPLLKTCYEKWQQDYRNFYRMEAQISKAENAGQPLLDMTEEQNAAKRVRKRILCVFIYRVKQYMGRKRMKGKVLAEFTNLINESRPMDDTTKYEEEDVANWAGLGQRYLLLGNDLGGLGTLILLPEEIADSVWDTLVLKGEERDVFLRQFKDRKIAEEADLIGAHDVVDSILGDMALRAARHIASVSKTPDALDLIRQTISGKNQTDNEGENRKIQNSPASHQESRPEHGSASLVTMEEEYGLPSPQHSDTSGVRLVENSPECSTTDATQILNSQASSSVSCTPAMNCRTRSITQSGVYSLGVLAEGPSSLRPESQLPNEHHESGHHKSSKRSSDLTVFENSIVHPPKRLERVHERHQQNPKISQYSQRTSSFLQPLQREVARLDTTLHALQEVASSSMPTQGRQTATKFAHRRKYSFQNRGSEPHQVNDGFQTIDPLTSNTTIIVPQATTPEDDSVIQDLAEINAYQQVPESNTSQNRVLPTLINQRVPFPDDNFQRFSSRFRVLSSPSLPKSLSDTESLFRLIKSYVENSCQSMMFDEDGNLLTPGGTKLNYGLCNDFDSYCFTATMLIRKNLHFHHALSKAFALVKQILQAEHPRTLPCFLEVLIHLIQTGLPDVANLLRCFIKEMSKETMNGQPWAQICRLLGELNSDSLDETLAQIWKCTTDTFETNLGTDSRLAVSVRLDYIKRVYGFAGKIEEESLLRDLLKKFDGIPNLSTPRVMLNLAHNLNGQGRHGEAEEMAMKVLSLLQENEIYSARIVETIECLKIVSHSQYYQWNRAAEQTMREAIQIIEDRWGSQHPWYLEFMNVLEGWLEGWGRKEDANKLRGEIDKQLGAGAM